MTNGIVLALVIVVVCAALVLLDVIVYVLRSGKSALYTKNGSPVNVDQVADQRRKDLAIWQAASPHYRVTGLDRANGADRSVLTRVVKLGDRKVQR